MDLTPTNISLLQLLLDPLVIKLDILKSIFERSATIVRK
jgi:hypothetical protein